VESTADGMLMRCPECGTEVSIPPADYALLDRSR
jgi:hypothetical protein